MNSVSYLLSRGNGKLGENIFGWSIPAVETCPGRSPTCERHCYARSGRYRTHVVQESLKRNLDAANDIRFVRWMISEIERRWCQVVRIHVAGDFFSAEYARKWVEIAKACPETTFYAYTRSWRIPEIVPALEELATLPNVRLWYSADDDTGRPDEVPEGVRIAWLMTTADETVEQVDLVFRTRPLRSTPAKRIGLTLVCPVENGLGADTDCGQCGHCWK